MWFCKGKIIKIQATTQIFIVALFYKINPAQNTTIIAENTENLSNSVPHTIKIKIQSGEKFSPIVVHNFGIFSSAKPIVSGTIANCSYTKSVKQEQIIAHKVYCERKCTTVLQTCDIPFIYAHNSFWCYKCN